MKVCFTAIYRRLNYEQDFPAVNLQWRRLQINRFLTVFFKKHFTHTEGILYSPVIPHTVHLWKKRMKLRRAEMIMKQKLQVISIF